MEIRFASVAAGAEAETPDWKIYDPYLADAIVACQWGKGI